MADGAVLGIEARAERGIGRQIGPGRPHEIGVDAGVGLPVLDRACVTNSRVYGAADVEQRKKAERNQDNMEARRKQPSECVAQAAHRNTSPLLTAFLMRPTERYVERYSGACGSIVVAIHDGVSDGVD
jgi:hypothetical protein